MVFTSLESIPSFTAFGHRLRVHLNGEDTIRQSDEQFDRTWPFSSNYQKTYMSDCVYGLFTCVTMPDVLPERLRICCDLITLLFLLDDYIDAEKDIGGVALARTVFEVFGGSIEPNSCLEDFAANLRSGIQFIDRCHAKNIYYKMEEFLANSRFDEREFNTVEEYLPFRRRNAGYDFITYIIRFGMDLCIETEEFSRLAHIDAFAGNYGILLNDMISYDREVREGENSANAVRIVLETEHCSVKAAKQKVLELAMENYAKYFAARDIYVTDHSASLEGKEYVLSLEWAMSGVEYWSVVTAKYR
ncbi:Aristolochene synthase [Neolecta irregularis DAH-3]|uniref:Terpene synthase n=1 Tax=Neolecta irregularis (strain DAH-3) TaxID=1198029 RepID=A0A1U7LMD1_NEOID|nr:Aristolochene synthase [Neolecta irregularis DAH-3]|eukprot:OLL23702.1 Aristolochene synthase [Neolecta irregularis DAH-3]